MLYVSVVSVTVIHCQQHGLILIHNILHIWSVANMQTEIWAEAQQYQQNDMCVQWRLRSAWASARSDQSSLSAWRRLGYLAFRWSNILWRLRSDWANVQADLSLRWAHMSFCWFCCAVAHYYSLCELIPSKVKLGQKKKKKMSCFQKPCQPLLFWGLF